MPFAEGKLEEMKRIVCFHLFNDYSGSPKVLHQILEELLRQGGRVDLVTSKGGVLSTLPQSDRLRMYNYNYRFSENGVVTMLRYSRVQLYTFFFAFRYCFKKDVVFYINTLLPVGPALAGRLMGKRVVYHYHENAEVKSAFYRMLSRAMQRLASEIVCVSAYQRSFLKREKGVRVIPNALPERFCSAFEGVECRTLTEPKTVLMLSSLKLYKGTLEFIELSCRLPEFLFQLVINDTQANIDAFLAQHKVSVPQNLSIFDRQDDVVPFYRKASLVLNLSNKDSFVETFGMTVLEAMTAALPVIVPTVGGVAEMVDDGVNGYKIDVRHLDEIERCVKEVLTNEDLYHKLSRHAKERAGQYDIHHLCRQMADLFEQ